MASSLSLRSILDTNKLTSTNYVDWLRNLEIVLSQEKLSYILDTPDIEPVGEDATEEEKATYRMWQNDSLTVKCIILASMTNELQRQHDSMDTQFKRRLLDMRYLSSYSVLEWQKDHSYKIMF